MPGADAIETFRLAAKEYVALLDAIKTQPRDEFLRGVSQALSALYRAGLDLPDGWDDHWQFRGQHPPPERAQKQLRSRLRAVLGEDDAYASVVAYGEHVGKDLGGSVSDDLEDIYVEVSTGLALLAHGSSPDEAAWLWHFGFWGHWGEHAVEALRIIHSHIAEDIGGTTLIAGGGH